VGILIDTVFTANPPLLFNYYPQADR